MTAASGRIAGALRRHLAHEWWCKMNQVEFRRLGRELTRTVAFLRAEPYTHGSTSRHCYCIKVNTGCVEETADLWFDWLDCWSIDDFVQNYSRQYQRVTQVSLRLFNPREIDEEMEGPQQCLIVFDIRNRLDDLYLGGLKRWPWD